MNEKPVILLLFTYHIIIVIFTIIIVTFIVIILDFKKNSMPYNLQAVRLNEFSTWGDVPHNKGGSVKQGDAWGKYKQHDERFSLKAFETS